MSKDPAEYLANFPPLLQSSLAILALHLIDANDDERSQALAWAKATAENESIPEFVRTFMKCASSVAGSVQAQAARNHLEALGASSTPSEE